MQGEKEFRQSTQQDCLHQRAFVKARAFRHDTRSELGDSQVKSTDGFIRNSF